MGIVTKTVDIVLKLSKPFYTYVSVEPLEITEDQLCIGI